MRQRSLQQELRVGFNSEQLNWTAGAYYLKDKGKEITQFEILGAGLLRTEYQDFLLPDPTDTSQLTDYSGNSIPMSPELTFNGLITYDVHLPDGSDVTLQTDFKYQDKVFFDSFNNPLMTQESYWMWNARAAWKSASGNWEAAAWVRNLADKEYLTYKFDLTFFGLYEEMLGSPRSLGAEVTYRM